MTTRVPLDEMFVFVAVVTEGGFTRAARKLGVAKQSVSERVARLESHLGVRLLERTTRSVKPTEIGQVYFERCRAIASEVADANEEARSRQREPSGSVRISAPYLFGRRFLSPIVAAYMRDHRDVTVEVVLGDGRVRLLEDGFDLAIRVGALTDSTLTSRWLGTVRVSTVASPALLGRTKLRDGKDLAKLPCVGMRPEETWTVDGKPLVVRPGLVVNDLEFVCSAAVAGLGVAQLPELVTREALADKRLRRVLERDPLRVPVYAVFPSRQFLPVKVRSFVERLVSARLLDTAGRNGASA
jgi:DNA-binding transcriptional LysR family regulator